MLCTVWSLVTVRNGLTNVGAFFDDLLEFENLEPVESLLFLSIFVSKILENLNK